MFTSTCPLKVQISLGLGPCFQIELLKTGDISFKAHVNIIMIIMIIITMIIIMIIIV